MINGRTTNDVAQQLGMTAATIATLLWRHKHLRPAAKIGNAYVWSDSDIERFMNRDKQKGGRPKKTI
jgi:hypothetical protein